MSTGTVTCHRCGNNFPVSNAHHCPTYHANSPTYYDAPGTRGWRPDLTAATLVVRDLFGGSCLNPPPMGVTLDLVRDCGKCAVCTRDWTPEAKAILQVTPPSIPLNSPVLLKALHALERSLCGKGCGCDFRIRTTAAAELRAAMTGTRQGVNP